MNIAAVSTWNSVKLRAIRGIIRRTAKVAAANDARMTPMRDADNPIVAP